MTVTEIRNILETPYDRKVWKGFIQTQFTNNKLFGNEQELLLNDNLLSNKCISLGNYEVDEFTKIGIFEVELSEKVNITRNRVALRNLIKEITKQVSGAMVVFVQGDKWRFSYISKRKVKNKETNQIEDKETAPKRYTYLFGKNEKALTAAIRFERLISKQKENIFQLLSLNDFEEAFSVEKLSKEFFKNYKDTYEDFVQFITGKRFAKKGNKYVEQIIHEPNWQLTSLFNKDEKQARDFCKRMMGRIVFLYFIQKKGWLAVSKGKKWGEGNQDYLFDLFVKSKFKDDFYHRELVPLFFKTLNNTDSENESNNLRFPYLNGGLFDDSLDRKYGKLQLPENIFQNLFETFNNYNFTIYEDAPDEHTVAVDPEMLGHIFENLLEDNKDKGAFYTPKEIVHYMCKESLKAYVIAHDEKHFTNNELAIRSIEKIIQQLELSNDEKQYAEKNAYKIIDALEQVKICDPAIGSGAFPMGLLQEIFNAQIYLQELKGFKKGVSDADIKKHIIEESIYGVDIDAGAVDISRLRFWLSLVVDEQVPQPLPNLNFKIVCANTLIPLGELKEYDMEGKAAMAVKALEELRHDFFNVSSEDKLRLERQFKKIQTDLLSLRELSSKANYDIYTKLYEFNPFEDTACSWFDAWWMFGVKDGFDIVIGNPPYGAIIDKNKNFYTKNFISAEGKHEIFKYFIEQGLKMLASNGILAYITPDTWTSLGYFKKLRKYIFENYSLEKVSKSLYNVFETATVDTNIIIIKNSKPTTNFLLVDGDLNNMIEKTLQDTTDFTLNLKDENELIAVIEKDSVLLDDKCEIWQGLIAYSEKIQPREFTAETKETDFHRKLLYGGDISKFHINWSGEYLKYGDWLHRPRPSYIFDDKKILVQRIRNPKMKTRLVCAFDDSGFINGTGLSNILLKKGIKDLKYKYLLSLLNSRLINYWFHYYFVDVNIKPEQLRKIPIKIIDLELQSKFEIIVEYLFLLLDKTIEPLFSHTENSRIASHFEDILNMMVYELYFNNHMKDVKLDVLQFISPKPLNNLLNSNLNIEIIKSFYLWLQTPDNPVRQRINIVDLKSPNILSKINLATQ